MENIELDNGQPAPTIEKISTKEIRNEQVKLDLEEDTPINSLIKSIMALEGEDLDKAIALVERKLEILKKLK